MVFESVSADIAVWTASRGARFAVTSKFACRIVPWFTKGRVREFGLIPRRISGLIFSVAAPVASFIDCPILRAGIRRFSVGLVRQIDCKLLARPLCRQQQLLRARGSPSETPDGPLSLPGLSVPPSL